MTIPLDPIRDVEWEEEVHAPMQPRRPPPPPPRSKPEMTAVETEGSDR
jgi:hypothetical protein